MRRVCIVASIFSLPNIFFFHLYYLTWLHSKLLRKNPERRLGASERDAEDVKKQAFFRVSSSILLLGSLCPMTFSMTMILSYDILKSNVSSFTDNALERFAQPESQAAIRSHRGMFFISFSILRRDMSKYLCFFKLGW